MFELIQQRQEVNCGIKAVVITLNYKPSCDMIHLSCMPREIKSAFGGIYSVTLLQILEGKCPPQQCGKTADEQKLPLSDRGDSKTSSYSEEKALGWAGKTCSLIVGQPARGAGATQVLV